MIRSDVPLEILYELAMSIGNSSDLEKNLQESLRAYLRKLHCCAGAVFTDGSNAPGRLVSCIPRAGVISRNRGYRAAMADPGWAAEELPSFGSAGWDYFYHWFELPEFGWLLLVRMHQPLSVNARNTLRDINGKLAQSARSCHVVANDLHESRHLLRNILDTIPARVWWKDRDLRFLGCNAAFAADLGLDSTDEVTGRVDEDLNATPHRSGYRAADLQVLATGVPKLLYEEPRMRSDGSERWIRASKVPLRNADDEIFGVLGVYEDITEEKRSREMVQLRLREREDLLAEIHHRIFNNLSIIAGLLNIQRADKDVGEDATRALIGARLRIESMALVYRNLYHAGDYETVDMTTFCRDVVAHVVQVYGQQDRIGAVVEDPCSDLPPDRAIPVALILNELVTNALRHGYPGDRTGSVTVSLRPEEGSESLILRVSDDGVGFRELPDPDDVTTMGIRLIQMLAQQLRGTVSVRCDGERTLVEVVFPR